jgi:hypothetical protein
MRQMAAAKGKKKERPIFGSIRKPTAPPTRKMGEDKPEQRIHPAERGSKHKKKIEPDEL